MTDSAATPRAQGDAPTAIRAALKRALAAQERNRKAFSAPYSGYEASAKYHESAGFVRGLAHALELLEQGGAS